MSNCYDHKNIYKAIGIIVSMRSGAKRFVLTYEITCLFLSYVRILRRLHATTLKLDRSVQQEAARFNAVNDESMQKHFATLKELIMENSLQQIPFLI